jgi:hypothetical protein
MKAYSNTNKLTLVTLFLLTVKVILQLYLYGRGFLSVSADEYSRGIAAARWALDGTLPTAIRMSDWLPFEIYINGLSLMVWDNVIWTPRITAFIFSCFLLVYFIKLVQYIFRLIEVTLIAGLLLVFNPWFIWLSGTPMLDIYMLAPFVAGLYYVLKWLSGRRDLHLIAGGFLFLLSTGFHTPSWILVNTVNLCLGCFAWDMLRRRDYRGLFRLIGFFILSNLFIIIYIPSEFLATGEWLSMFRGHTEGTKVYYGGYNVGLFRKLAYYPKLVAASGNLTWIFFSIGLFWLGSKPDKVIRLFPFAVGLSALFFYSLFNVFSVPASAAPARYSLPFFILFVPYAALGIFVLFNYSGYFTDVRIRRAAAAILILCILGLNFMKALDFEAKSAGAAVSVGRYLKEGMEKDLARSDGTVMVELTYWDFLYVELAARYFDRVRFDREESDEFSGIPSALLSMGDDDILQHMQKEKTRFIAVKDDALKKRLTGLGFMHKSKELDGWTIYSVELNQDKQAEEPSE